MAKQEARTQALLRERDAAKRTRQVWAGATIVWGVVLGWVIWGFINAVTDVADSRVVWLLVYLLPVIVLGIGTWVVSRRIRSIDARILDVAEESTKNH
jgi:hypothetical protein